MVRQGSHDRTTNCARSCEGETATAPTNASRTPRRQRTGQSPVLVWFIIRMPVRQRGCAPVSGVGPAHPAQSVLQPGRRDDEQRREKESEQRVEPDQRNVETAKRDSDPQRSQRTMSFQPSAPER